MMRRLLFLVALLAACAGPAAAHLTPNSEVRLDFARDSLTAEVLIPLGELSYALGGTGPARLGPAPAALTAYVLPRLAARAPDGRPWVLTLKSAEIVADAGGPDYIARIEMRPPPGASLRR